MSTYKHGLVANWFVHPAGECNSWALPTSLVVVSPTAEFTLNANLSCSRFTSQCSGIAGCPACNLPDLSSPRRSHMELSKATLELLRDEAYVVLIRETVQENLKALEGQKAKLVNSRP